MSRASVRSNHASGSAQRAQSEVIGIVLLTAVVVILATIVGGAILATVDTQDEPVANLHVSVSDSNVTISHYGGSPLVKRDVTVILRDATSERYRLTSFAGDAGDRTFSPGEQVTHSHDANGTLRVLIVHRPSNTILHDRTYDVP